MSRMWASDRQQRRGMTRRVEGRPTSDEDPHSEASAGLPGAPMTSSISGRVPDGTPTTPKAGARRRPANRSPKPPGSNRPSSRPWLTKLLFLVNCFNCCLDPQDDEEDVRLENETTFRGKPAAARPAPASTTKAGHAPTAPSGAGDWGSTTIIRGGDEARPEHDARTGHFLQPSIEDYFGDEGLRVREASEAKEPVEEADLAAHHSPTPPDVSEFAANKAVVEDKQPIREDPSRITPNDRTLRDAGSVSENRNTPSVENALRCEEGTEEIIAINDPIALSTSGEAPSKPVTGDTTETEEDDSKETTEEEGHDDDVSSIASDDSFAGDERVLGFPTCFREKLSAWARSIKDLRLTHADIFERGKRPKLSIGSVKNYARKNPKARAPVSVHARRFGEGAFSDVFLVTPTEGYPGRMVIKRTFINPRLDMEKFTKDVHRAIEEAKTLQDINKNFASPYIVNLIDAAEKNGAVFLLLEEAKGGDLSKLRGRVKDDDVIVYIAACLGHAVYIMSGNESVRRAGGYVHLDLKPANVLLRANCLLAITDFNTASKLDANVRYINVGTKDFQAPEVIVSPEYDHRADVWSLGAVLEDLIKTGNNNTSPDVHHLIKAMCAEDPTKRPGTWEEFKSYPCFSHMDWDAVAAGTIPPPPALVDHVNKQVARRDTW